MSLQGPLTRTECETILAPHLADLERCFLKAGQRWRKWVRTFSGSPTDISSRTQSSSMHDLITAEVVRVFLGKPGVRIRRRRGLLLLTFNDRITIRFKKYRYATLKTATNATSQSKLFDDQALDLGPDLQPVTHLVAGYLLDKLNFGYRRLALTCQINGHHVWAPIDIEASQLATITPLSSATTKPRGEKIGRKSRVRSTRPLVKDDSDGG